jgi:hypothetical protein
MEDLRKSSRVEAHHFISIDLLDENERVIRSGMALSRNLSRTGVQIEDRQPFPMNATVRLHLALADEIVDVTGIVRHVEEVSENEYHIGIEFAEIDDDVMHQVKKAYPNLLKK